MLPPELKDARPKRLRFRVFTLAAKVTYHARRVLARIVGTALALAGLVTARAQNLALIPH